MTRKRKPYKTYSKEFKLEALRLMEKSDRPTSEVAMQLNNGAGGIKFYPGRKLVKKIIPSSSFSQTDG